MATRLSGAVLRSLGWTAPSVAATDRELLARFAEGDETAFAVLVGRHSGLVLGACRRVLPTLQDAEDACQATFLILARKAKTGRWRASVANWLYATARTVALQARRAARRRVQYESRALAAREPSVLDQMTGREAFAALDEELDRLPALYREPLVLCHLEGRTRDEAASQLGVAMATVKIRLERGRKRLADALTKRGIELGAGLLAAAATSTAGASPPRLVASILAAAGGSPSPAVAALAQGVAVNGILSKAKVAVVALIGVAVLSFGFASLPVAAEPQRPADDKREKTEAKERTSDRVITGKIVAADGKPLAADLVHIASDGPPRFLGRAAADGTFRVVVPALRPGSFLIARTDGHGVGFLGLGGDTTAPVTLALPPDHPIRGRVIDTQGRPVAGAVVTPQRIDDYGARGAGLFLDHWRAKDPQSGMLYGEKELRVSDGSGVLEAKTDGDGRFELRGLGAERVVSLLARGAGVADTEALVVNRPGFDPAEANRTAADNRARLMPMSLRGRRDPVLHGPTLTLVAEPERVIRGVVRDRATGTPRPNVTVTFGRVGPLQLPDRALSATTDAQGRYTIRGSRKYSAYSVEVAADAASRFLPAQAEAQDTAGYAPIDLDIECAQGVLITGRMTDGGTGKPLAGIVSLEPMKENPYLQKYPTMTQSRMGLQQVVTGPDGSFRLVSIPGPVLVMAGLRVAQDEVKYRPPQADPKYPQYFRGQAEVGLMYVTANGSYTTLRGCWCRVLEVADGTKDVSLNVTLEPAPHKVVRVVDRDGKPVSSCHAAGLVPRNLYPILQEGGTVTVYSLVPKEERLVVACDQGRRWVGSVVVREADPAPTLTLAPGGAVAGRATDTDGRPIAGVVVQLHHTAHPADAVAGRLHDGRQVTTDGQGRFHLDGVIPGQEFHLSFGKGSKRLGPKTAAAPRYVVDKPGAVKDVGDVRLAAVPNDY